MDGFVLEIITFSGVVFFMGSLSSTKSAENPWSCDNIFGNLKKNKKPSSKTLLLNYILLSGSNFHLNVGSSYHNHKIINSKQPPSLKTRKVVEKLMKILEQLPKI